MQTRDYRTQDCKRVSQMCRRITEKIFGTTIIALNYAASRHTENRRRVVTSQRSENHSRARLL